MPFGEGNHFWKACPHMHTTALNDRSLAILKKAKYLVPFANRSPVKQLVSCNLATFKPSREIQRSNWCVWMFSVICQEKLQSVLLSWNKITMIKTSDIRGTVVSSWLIRHKSNSNENRAKQDTVVLDFYLRRIKTHKQRSMLNTCKIKCENCCPEREKMPREQKTSKRMGE